jgi:uncharacterized protein (DUF305 family)
VGAHDVSAGLQAEGASTEEALAPDTSSRRRALPIVLVAVLTVAALVAALTLGHLWGTHSAGSGGSVADSSIDAGFARDMSTHHVQAVTMAGYERDHTIDASLKLLAYDIETSQQFQVGQMQGWLDVWGLSRESSRPVMGWMGGHAHLDGGLMPGLATPAQMTKLESSTGKTLDVLFLQLMIRHHQGGLAMAQYAADHAGKSYVRDLAQSMINAQSAEVIEMERLLRQLGGSPLSPPAN